MTRSLLLLVALGLLALPPAWGGEWSGTIEVVETLSGAEAPASARRELDEMAKVLEERLARTRVQLKTATPVIAKTLREDLAHLEAELELLVVERGGSVQVGRTLYRIAGPRVLSDGDEARVLLDWQARKAVVAVAGKRESLPLGDPPAAREPGDTAPGPDLLGHATRRCTLKADGQSHVVLYAPGLPNPYALALLPQVPADSLHGVLATLPGLPLLVEWRRRSVVMRWTVRSVVPGALDAGLFADP